MKENAISSRSHKQESDGPLSQSARLMRILRPANSEILTEEIMDLKDKIAQTQINIAMK